MSVARLACLVLSLGGFTATPLFGQSAAAATVKPECLGFDPYIWTREQIEACVGPVDWGPGLNPYNSSGQPLFVPVKVQAFANVLVGAEGHAIDHHAFLTLENDTETNWVRVVVRREFGPEIVKGWVLRPGQRMVVRMNEWPELAAALPLGVSVRVQWQKEGNAGVAMHRARDFGSMVQAVEGGGRK